MSVAIDAIVLIKLRERLGDAVGVRELADLMQVDELVVGESFDRLEGHGGVVVKRIVGLPFWAAAMPQPKAGDAACA